MFVLIPPPFTGAPQIPKRNAFSFFYFVESFPSKKKELEKRKQNPDCLCTPPTPHRPPTHTPQSDFLILSPSVHFASFFHHFFVPHHPPPRSFSLPNSSFFLCFVPFSFISTGPPCSFASAGAYFSIFLPVLFARCFWLAKLAG